MTQTGRLSGGGPDQPRFSLDPVERWSLTALAAIGVIAAAVGSVLAPDRAWGSWLVMGHYAIGLGLAGLCFVAIHYTTGASWSVAIRRIPEGLAGTLLFGSLLLALAFLARPELYPWTSGSLIATGGSEWAFKRWWLSWPFFLVRAAIYCTLWIGFAFAIRRRSRKQDADGDPRWTEGNARLSAAFLVVFGATFSLASIDWTMSLEPQWFSTIFGIYAFAGLFVSGVAAIILVAIWLERRGPLGQILSDDHLHDLGKLLFAFSAFWMYIWFSQYLLIWYTNIPEETSYFERRLHGGWGVLVAANVVLNWIVPFAVLLRRDAKRDRRTLAWVAGTVLIGRWLDLYLMIFPTVVGETPRVGVWEIGVTVGATGAFGLVLAWVLGRAPAVPLADPQLKESLDYGQWVESLEVEGSKVES